MKQILAAMVISVLLMLTVPACAAIYKYIDDKGQTNYTNVLSSVPPDKRQGVIKIKEYENKNSPVLSSPVFKETQVPQDSIDSIQKFVTLEKKKRKAKLKAEYKRILKEKQDLDNNKSFQKRRLKKRYQKRPYIKSLVRKEKLLSDRLKELEEKLKNLDKQ